MQRKIDHKLEQLEPRLLLSADGMVDILPAPDTTHGFEHALEQDLNSIELSSQNDNLYSSEGCDKSVVSLELLNTESILEFEEIDADLFSATPDNVELEEDTSSTSEDNSQGEDKQVDACSDNLLDYDDYSNIEIQSSYNNDTIYSYTDELVDTLHAANAPPIGLVYYASAENNQFTLQSNPSDTSSLGLIDSICSDLRFATPIVEDQIIYMEFDGAYNVTYNGPVQIHDINIPSFSVPEYVGIDEAALISQITNELNTLFAGTGVVFTSIQPEKGIDYSTIFVGGDGAAFSEYGNFLGLAEAVDEGNSNKSDNAFVFVDNINNDSFNTVQFKDTLITTIVHETGHILGYAHNTETNTENPLAPVARSTELDNFSTTAINTSDYDTIRFNDDVVNRGGTITLDGSANKITLDFREIKKPLIIRIESNNVIVSDNSDPDNVIVLGTIHFNQVSVLDEIYSSSKSDEFHLNSLDLLRDGAEIKASTSLNSPTEKNTLNASNFTATGLKMTVRSGDKIRVTKIENSNEKKIINFRFVQNLIGTNVVDELVFNQNTELSYKDGENKVFGTYNGNNGNDILDFSNWTSALTFKTLPVAAASPVLQVINSRGDILGQVSNIKIIKGGDHNSDTLDFSSITDPVNATLAVNQNSSNTTDPGGVASVNAVPLYTGITKIENLTGGSNDDTLTGSSENNILQGNGGDDILSGGLGSDTYKFSEYWGEDTLNYFNGDNDKDYVVFDSSMEIFPELEIFTPNWNQNPSNNIPSYFATGQNTTTTLTINSYETLISFSHVELIFTSIPSVYDLKIRLDQTNLQSNTNIEALISDADAESYTYLLEAKDVLNIYGGMGNNRFEFSGFASISGILYVNVDNQPIGRKNILDYSNYANIANVNLSNSIFSYDLGENSLTEISQAQQAQFEKWNIVVPKANPLFYLYNTLTDEYSSAIAISDATPNYLRDELALLIGNKTFTVKKLNETPALITYEVVFITYENMDQAFPDAFINLNNIFVGVDNNNLSVTKSSVNNDDDWQYSFTYSANDGFFQIKISHDFGKFITSKIRVSATEQEVINAIRNAVKTTDDTKKYSDYFFDPVVQKLLTKTMEPRH